MSKPNNGPNSDPDKITNQDEQDVVVNRSTATESGYDEPVSESSRPRAEKGNRPMEEEKPREKRTASPEDSPAPEK